MRIGLVIELVVDDLLDRTELRRSVRWSEVVGAEVTAAGAQFLGGLEPPISL